MVRNWSLATVVEGGGVNYSMRRLKDELVGDFIVTVVEMQILNKPRNFISFCIGLIKCHSRILWIISCDCKSSIY